MALNHHTKISVDENIVMIRETNGIVGDITSSLKTNYELEYKSHSLYYSGHEWSDKRKETGCYEVMKNEVKIGFLEIYREQRDLLYPTKDFPFGVADISITVSLELEDQGNKNLADNLANLFERLEKIASSK